MGVSLTDQTMTMVGRVMALFDAFVYVFFTDEINWHSNTYLFSSFNIVTFYLPFAFYDNKYCKKIKAIVFSTTLMKFKIYNSQRVFVTACHLNKLFAEG